MNRPGGVFLVMIAVPALLGLASQAKNPKNSQRDTNGTVSFQGEVFPIIEKYCLPCHAEESYNPSELSLDSYELLMKGGKHGSPVEPGKPKESILVKKLSPDPPFGDPMPLNVRRRKNSSQAKKLTEEEIQLITTWIAQGAKNK